MEYKRGTVYDKVYKCFLKDVKIYENGQVAWKWMWLVDDEFIIFNKEE